QIYMHTGKLCSSEAAAYSKSSSPVSSQYNSSTQNTEIHPPTMKEKNTGKPDFSRVFSFPRFPSPRPVQKEAVCSELRCLRRDEGAVLGINQGQKENGPMFINREELSPSSAREKLLGNPVLHCSVGRQGCLLNTAGTGEKEGRETSHCDGNLMVDVLTKQRYSQCSLMPKKAMIHNWISEHRCIWKEARVKACLLPAIAEV
ncbi:hypothetical protein N332_11042, partial [Mesitornis unicolor]